MCVMCNILHVICKYIIYKYIKYTKSFLQIFCASDNHYILIRVHHSYDLVLKFDSDFLRSTFIKAFERFISDMATSGNVCSIQMITNISYTALLKQAITKKQRQKKLEMFFRVVFAQVYFLSCLVKYLNNIKFKYIHNQAFHIAHTEEEILQIDSLVAREVIYTELTIIEFAEALSMKPDAEFVKKVIFTLNLISNVQIYNTYKYIY